MQILKLNQSRGRPPPGAMVDEDIWIIISYIVTLFSSLFVSAYKINDKVNKKKEYAEEGP